MSKREYCGFCGKREDEVERLIDGPENAICNECIELMHSMLSSPPTTREPISLAQFKAKHGRAAP